MSETSILPGATPAGAAAPPAPPIFDDEGSGDDRRRLMIIGGIVAGVLVLVVAFLVLKGGGSSSADSTGLVPRGTPHAAPSASAPTGSSGQPGTTKGGHGKAGTVLPPKSHTRLSRDPFKPRVVAAVDTGSVTGSTTVTPAPSSEPGTVPTSPSEGGAGNKSLGNPLSIQLVRVHGAKSALFAVTYGHHKVYRYDVLAPSASSTQGTVFAQDFSLLGIQGNEATVQIGDDTPFDLKVGASHAV